LKAEEAEPAAALNDVYAIGVYGVPGSSFKGDRNNWANPWKKEAALKREGKTDLKPASVEVFQRSDGLLVIYMFPLSAEITKKDGYVVFDAHIGRVMVSHAFNLGRYRPTFYTFDAIYRPARAISKKFEPEFRAGIGGARLHLFPNDDPPCAQVPGCPSSHHFQEHIAVAGHWYVN
jgi:hypothetical protein